MAFGPLAYNINSFTSNDMLATVAIQRILAFAEADVVEAVLTVETSEVY